MTTFDDDLDRWEDDQEELETYIIACKKIRESEKAILFEFNIKGKDRPVWINTRHYWIPKSVIIFGSEVTYSKGEIEVAAWFIDNLEEEHGIKIIKE